jgi:hypothetical protein
MITSDPRGRRAERDAHRPDRGAGLLPDRPRRKLRKDIRAPIQTNRSQDRRSPHSFADSPTMRFEKARKKGAQPRAAVHPRTPTSPSASGPKASWSAPEQPEQKKLPPHSGNLPRKRSDCSIRFSRQSLYSAFSDEPLLTSLYAVCTMSYRCIGVFA